MKNYLNNAENLGTEANRKWFFGKRTAVVFLGKNISKSKVRFCVFGGERGELWDNFRKPPDVFLPLYSFIDSTHRKY